MAGIRSIARPSFVLALALTACGGMPVGSRQDLPDTDASDLAQDILDEHAAEAPTEPSDLPAAEDLVLDEPADLPPQPPPRPRITVNSIPDQMNGKEPYTQSGGPPQAFRPRVSAGGFTVDVYRRPDTQWDGAVEVTCSAPLLVEGKKYPPGADLVPILDCTDESDPAGWEDEGLLRVKCRVPPSAVDPSPDVLFTARFRASDGTPGVTDSITVEVAALPPKLDPFPHTDVWVVVLSRDIFSHEVVAGPDGTYDVTSEHLPGGNGKPDLDEALAALGLLSSNADFSTKARAFFLARVREKACAIFGLDASGKPANKDAVDLALLFEGDPGAPDPATWTADSTFSKIAFGGDPDPAGIAKNLVGTAKIDANNQHHEDDTPYKYGVFVTSIVRQALKHPVGATLLHEISPLDGLPLGMYPGDEQFLDQSFDSEDSPDERLKLRHAIFKAIMDFATLGAATTLCHEMGHSLGLVPNGPPPSGLFGGMDGLSFTTSDTGPWHIDTPGLNIMQTGKVTNWLEALSGKARFNQLNLAYLRRRLVVGEL